MKKTKNHRKSVGMFIRIHAISSFSTGSLWVKRIPVRNLHPKTKQEGKARSPLFISKVGLVGQALCVITLNLNLRTENLTNSYSFSRSSRDKLFWWKDWLSRMEYWSLEFIGATRKESGKSSFFILSRGRKLYRRRRALIRIDTFQRRIQRAGYEPWIMHFRVSGTIGGKGENLNKHD